jgi:hypothetical protein
VSVNVTLVCCSLTGSRDQVGVASGRLVGGGRHRQALLPAAYHAAETPRASLVVCQVTTSPSQTCLMVELSSSAKARYSVARHACSARMAMGSRCFASASSSARAYVLMGRTFVFSCSSLPSLGCGELCCCRAQTERLRNSSVLARQVPCAHCSDPHSHDQ